MVWCGLDLLDIHTLLNVSHLLLVISRIANDKAFNCNTAGLSYVLQSIGSNDDYATAMAKHDDKLVVIKFYDQFCRACDEIRPRFEDLSRSLPEEDAVFYELEVGRHKKLGILRYSTFIFCV